jgi:hypothetical protein
MKSLTSSIWVAVVIITLALSNWSLFAVGRHYGLPIVLAAVLSVPFDGAALVCADISLKYAREHGANGAGPRSAVTILAGLSAWLNSLHATLLHVGMPAHVMYAVPPLVALFLFEAHTRYERRGALPILGAFIWSRHPVVAHKAMQAISGQRLFFRLSIEQAWIASVTAIASTPRELARATTQADAVRVALRVLGDEAPRRRGCGVAGGSRVDCGQVLYPGYPVP